MFMKKNKVHFETKNQAGRIFVLIALGFLLLSVNSLKASEPLSLQQPTLTGKITEAATDSAMVGVTVQVMYSTDPSAKAVKSQKDGTYSLSLPAGAKTILFSLNGYQTMMVDIAGREVVNVVLTKNEEDPTLW
jgi:TonB-dependent starch-binding outer membrane protein SusC